MVLACIRERVVAEVFTCASSGFSLAFAMVNARAVQLHQKAIHDLHSLALEILTPLGRSQLALAGVFAANIRISPTR